MALDVAEFLWNKFLKSLAELESELSGYMSIPIFQSIKNLMSEFKEIKDVGNERDIMPERYTYSKTIDVLYDLNDALAECRIFAHECKEGNKNWLSFYFRRIKFVTAMRSKLNTIKEHLQEPAAPTVNPVGTAGPLPPSEVIGSDEPSDPKMGALQQEIGKPLEKIRPKILPKVVKQSEEIEGLLLRKGGTSSTSAGGFTAIGVVGIAGVGKTTLVQKVLESEEVKKKIDPILWLPFSGIREGEQQYSRFSFETCILEYYSGETLEERIVGIDSLLDRLSPRLFGKRYLIVLDDVCYKHVNIMERLVSGLPKPSCGAVIVTTRLMEVAQKLGDQQHLILVKPQQDVCSKIFEEIIQNDKKLSSRKTLEKIKEMKDQCHGLPLVAKALAQIIPETLVVSI